MMLLCPRVATDAETGARDAASAQTAANWLNADSFLAGLRRVNIFCGGFGSGKTEVAVNFALHARELGRRVSIADLDIVNLYFRSREVRNQLRSRGVEMLVPSGALADADLPIVVPEIKGALEGQRMKDEGGGMNAGIPEVQSPMSGVQGRPLIVLDLGGDPAGAKVMASMAGAMGPDDYSSFFVLNSRRPFTATVAAAQQMMAGISAAAKIKVDRIVVNSHLIDETTPAVIDEGIALGEALARATGAEIAFVAVGRAMLERFDAAGCGYPVMVLDRLMLKPWEPSNWLGKYRVSTSEIVN
jgi:hypothetical protein